jgi:hypothetical protein
MSAPDLVIWFQAHCRECRWVSAECRSQNEALAGHAAHQRWAHPELWGAA